MKTGPGHLFILVFMSAVLGLAACARGGGKDKTQESPPDTAQSAFDADAAWTEFEDMFRLFYAYIDRDDFDVEGLLARTEVLARAQTSAEDFRAVIRRMSYGFTDPHLIAGPLGRGDYNLFPTSADMIAAERDGAYFVADVRAGSAAFKSGVRPGWEIKSIDGQSPGEIISAVFGGLIDAPTQAQRSYVITLAVNGRRESGRNIMFEIDGRAQSAALPSPREFATALSKAPILQSRKIGNTGVIRINNSLGNNDLITAFDGAMADMQTAKYLILDLRNTPSGGNTEVGRSLIGHFLTRPRAYQRHEIPSLEREFTVPRHFVEYAKPRAPYFDPKNTVVLGGPWTGSMGEGVVIGLDAAADMTVIASGMGDLLGGLSNRRLPASGLRLDLGTESLFHVDGTPREDFQADIILSAAETDETGRDPAMKAARAYFDNMKD